MFMLFTQTPAIDVCLPRERPPGLERAAIHTRRSAPVDKKVGEWFMPVKCYQDHNINHVTVQYSWWVIQY